MLETLWQDVRYGARLWRRNPALALAAAGSLALGIAVASAMFLIVNAALLRPPPVADPDELVLLFNGPRDDPFGTVSYPDYVDFRDGALAFQGLAAYGETAVSLAHDGSPEEERAVIASGNFFEVLGVRAALGRVLAPVDDRVPGGHPVAVLSHGLWRRRFGSDRAIVGREITVNGRPYAVIGVTPLGFRGPDVFESYELYLPMAMQAHVRPPRARYSADMDPDLLERRGSSWLRVVGRLAPGVGIEEAQASIAAISAQLERIHPQTNRGEEATLFPLRRIDPRAYPLLRSVAFLLSSVGGLVLLVATANVTNLLLVRAVARRREIAVRLAMGVSRARLARQFLTETLLLAAVAGPMGLLLASWALDGLAALVPATGIFSFDLDFVVDGRVLAFTLAASVLSTVLVGVAPAVRSSRPDLVTSLRDGIAAAGSRFRARDLLVVAQIALSIVLLVGAGLFLKSFWISSAIEPGFAVGEILTAEIRIDLLGHTRARGREIYREILERTRALPGVRAASLSRTVPLAGGGRLDELVLEGFQPPGSGEELVVATNVVGTDYLRAMGIPLLRGRDFTARDDEGAPGVVLANESFVARYFPSGKATGRRVRLDRDSTEWLEIVGVVKDSKYRTLGEERTPFLYQPLAQQHETGMTLLVRTAAPEALAPEIRRLLLAIEPNLPVSEIRPIGALVESSLFPSLMGARLLAACAALAVVLAAVGLYGVMSFAVSRRTRELGIRIALGARPGELVRMVIGEGLVLVAAGLALGWIAAASCARLVSSFLFGVSATDPVTFLGVGALLALVMLAAASLPARRAACSNPLLALRCE